MKNKKFDKKQFIFTIIYVVISLILLGISLYKIIKFKDLNAASLETSILFGISLIYVVLKFLKDKNFAPTNIKGEKLPVKDNKIDKKKRFKNYLIESLIFSIIVVCLDLLAMWFLKDKNSLFNFSSNNITNIILNSLVTFGICMLISFGLESLIGEISVKKINKNK